MKLTFTTSGGNSTEIEVGKDATFGSVKEVLAVEFKTKPENILISYKNDTSIPDTATLGSQGVEENDLFLVILLDEAPRPPPAGSNAARAQEALARARRNASNAVAAGGNAPSGLEQLIPPQFRGLDFAQLFNPQQPTAEVQAQRQRKAQAINENYALAMEQSPEAFASVYMLYIDVEINGVPVKAFVDSGAQSTVMSKKCAERTGVIDLVDPRFAGVAVGVGQAKILGRVHLNPIKMGESFYKCSFSVIENMHEMDLLIGLDLLKKYQCSIDLKNDCLTIGTTGETIKFLPERDLPKHAKLTKQR